MNFIFLLLQAVGILCVLWTLMTPFLPALAGFILQAFIFILSFSYLRRRKAAGKRTGLAVFNGFFHFIYLLIAGAVLFGITLPNEKPYYTADSMKGFTNIWYKMTGQNDKIDRSSSEKKKEPKKTIDAGSLNLQIEGDSPSESSEKRGPDPGVEDPF